MFLKKLIKKIRFKFVCCVRSSCSVNDENNQYNENNEKNEKKISS